MRLLVVMASYPFPSLTGGTTLAYHNIKELSKRHSVHLLCFAPPKEHGDFAAFVEDKEFVRRKKGSRFMQALRNACYMAAGVPSLITQFMSREMNHKVRELTQRVRFDAILLYELHAIQYCPPEVHGKVLVNIEDPMAIKFDRMRSLPVWSAWQRARLFVHARFLSRFEGRFLPKMAKVLLLSQADMRDMRERTGYGNLGQVSYGVDTRPAGDILDCEKRAEGMIVFSGNMFHPPNVDGALFFLQDVFPSVLREYPAARFWIVGADPDARIRAAAASFGEKVVITGRVKAMAEYLQRAKACVCPVRLRIGVQTKILEALSWGTPVVTTSAGNSGIGGISGQELWVADDPRMFASRVAALLRSEDWRQLSQAGRALASRGFSWERSARELEQHLLQVQAAGGRPSPNESGVS